MIRLAFYHLFFKNVFRTVGRFRDCTKCILGGPQSPVSVAPSQLWICTSGLLAGPIARRLQSRTVNGGTWFVVVMVLEWRHGPFQLCGFDGNDDVFVETRNLFTCQNIHCWIFWALFFSLVNYLHRWMMLDDVPVMMRWWCCVLYNRVQRLQSVWYVHTIKMLQTVKLYAVESVWAWHCEWSTEDDGRDIQERTNQVLTFLFLILNYSQDAYFQ